MNKPKIIIVGATLSGITLAKKLSEKKFDIWLVDKNNYFLFTPFIPDLTNFFLSIKDIAIPIRTIFTRHSHINIVMDLVTKINRANKKICFNKNKCLNYDYLVLAKDHHKASLSLNEKKISSNSLLDWQILREKTLLSLEKASLCKSYNTAKKYLSFVVVGSSTFSIELACALTNIYTLLKNFKNIDKCKIKIYLIGTESSFLEKTAPKIRQLLFKRLEKLGIIILYSKKITKRSKNVILVDDKIIESTNIFWTDNEVPSSLNNLISIDNKAVIDTDFSLISNPEIFSIDNNLNLSDTTNISGDNHLQAVDSGLYLGKILNKEKLKKTNKTFLNNIILINLGKYNAIAAYGNVIVSGIIGKIIYCITYVSFIPQLRNKLRMLYRWIIPINSRRSALIYESKKS